MSRTAHEATYELDLVALVLRLESVPEAATPLLRVVHGRHLPMTALLESATRELVEKLIQLGVLRRVGSVTRPERDANPWADDAEVLDVPVME